MCAICFRPRVVIAKTRVKEAAAQSVEHIRYNNALGQVSQRITAVLPALAVDKTSLAQNAQHLADIVVRDAFRLADFGNGLTDATWLTSQMQQTAQTVFFL